MRYRKKRASSSSTRTLPADLGGVKRPRASGTSHKSHTLRWRAVRPGSPASLGQSRVPCAARTSIPLAARARRNACTKRTASGWSPCTRSVFASTARSAPETARAPCSPPPRSARCKQSDRSQGVGIGSYPSRLFPAGIGGIAPDALWSCPRRAGEFNGKTRSAPSSSGGYIQVVGADNLQEGAHENVHENEAARGSDDE